MPTPFSCSAALICSLARHSSLLGAVPVPSSGGLGSAAGWVPVIASVVFSGGSNSERPRSQPRWMAVIVLRASSVSVLPPIPAPSRLAVRGGPPVQRVLPQLRRQAGLADPAGQRSASAKSPRHGPVVVLRGLRVDGVRVSRGRQRRRGSPRSRGRRVGCPWPRAASRASGRVAAGASLPASRELVEPGRPWLPGSGARRPVQPTGQLVRAASCRAACGDPRVSSAWPAALGRCRRRPRRGDHALGTAPGRAGRAEAGVPGDGGEAGRVIRAACRPVSCTAGRRSRPLPFLLAALLGDDQGVRDQHDRGRPAVG